MPTHVRTFGSSFLGETFDPPRTWRRGVPRHHTGSGGGRRSAGAAAQSDDMSPAARRRQLLAEREDLMVDTQKLEEPEFDQKRERLNQLITGGGAAIALLGALGGSEIATAAGQGLAKGGAGNLQRQRQAFRQRRQRFQNRLQSAREANRNVALSTNEAQFRGVEQQAQRQFEQEQAQRGHSRQEQLIRLRTRLENQMTPQEKKKFQKELQLLDEEIKSQEALTTERQTRAEANRAMAKKRRRSDSGEEEEQRPYQHLQDEEIRSMLKRSQFILDQGAPPSADLDASGTVDQSEIQGAARAGISMPSESDRDRVAERVSQLRREAMRRGLLDDEGGGENGQSARGGGPVTTQESVFNEAAHGRGQRQKRRSGGEDQSSDGGGSRMSDDYGGTTGELPSGLRRHILDQVPSDVNIQRVLNAAALVRSDTTDFTPQAFERAYGFNPFE